MLVDTLPKILWLPLVVWEGSESTTLRLEGHYPFLWEHVVLQAAYCVRIVSVPLNILFGALVVVFPTRATAPIVILLASAILHAGLCDWQDQVTMNYLGAGTGFYRVLAWPVQTLGGIALPLALSAWYFGAAKRAPRLVVTLANRSYDAAPPIWRSLVPITVAALAAELAARHWSVLLLFAKSFSNPKLAGFAQPWYWTVAALIVVLIAAALVMWLQRSRDARTLILLTCVSYGAGAFLLIQEEDLSVRYVLESVRVPVFVTLLAALYLALKYDVLAEQDSVCAQCGYFVGATDGDRCPECGEPRRTGRIAKPTRGKP